MRILLAAGLAVLFLCAAAAQTPRPGMPAPPVDAELSVDEAVISGRVTDERTGRPLVKASVSLAPVDQPISKTTTTDETGRFEFAGLTPGDYQIFGRAPGYLVWAYRQQVYGGPSVDVGVNPTTESGKCASLLASMFTPR